MQIPTVKATSNRRPKNIPDRKQIEYYFLFVTCNLCKWQERMMKEMMEEMAEEQLVEMKIVEEMGDGGGDGEE